MWSERQNKGGGAARFLKIESGKPPVAAIFRGEPRLFQSHFDNATRRSSECTGDGCVGCKTSQPKDRFRVNAIVREGDSYVSKIFEGNGFTYDHVVSLMKAGYEIEKTVLMISKTGSGTQAKTIITPTPKPLSPEAEAIISKTPLLKLTNDQEGQPPGQEAGDPGFDPSSVPF